MVRIKAFRATSDPESCQRYIEGHRRVLDIVGVKQVTSAKVNWASNPAAFVILVESTDGTKVYGGARIHVFGGTQPLPIEEATGEMDSAIFPLVHQYARHGTGELCGLWNSREVAGMGIGSTFLTRAGVTIVSQLGLESLFALCAPYTVKMAENVGFVIEKTLGNEGTFYYPKLDLLATAMILKDPETLTSADPFERERIFSLRDQPKQTAHEIGRTAEFDIEYDLFVPMVDKNEFKTA
ncbi:MAG: hypothetical protein M3Q97_04380 [Bacteroidota bacterium]|nr:hypothetical protein [Bacteroidota bacterium]